METEEDKSYVIGTSCLIITGLTIIALLTFGALIVFK